MYLIDLWAIAFARPEAKSPHTMAGSGQQWKTYFERQSCINSKDSADSDVIKAWANGKVLPVLSIPTIFARGSRSSLVLNVASVSYIKQETNRWPSLICSIDIKKMDDISSPESKLHGKRLRAKYCGRTHYDIDHIKFYCDCLIDQWRTYRISRSNCLMWSFALTAYIVDRETTSIRDLWANPQRLMTLNELRKVEARRDGEEQEEVPAGPKRQTLTFYLRERVIRVSLLADALQPKARLRLDTEERLPPFVSRETEGPDIVPSYVEYLWSDDEMWTSMIFSDKLSRLRKRIFRA